MSTYEELRETLGQVMRRAESDLASAHREICRLQGVSSAEGDNGGTHKWPEWSSPAHTLLWFESIRKKFEISAAP